jgi:hypothetical protein
LPIFGVAKFIWKIRKKYIRLLNENRVFPFLKKC